MRLNYTVLSGRSASYTFSVTCDDSTTGCKEQGWIAHMNDNTRVMNFCASFFTEPLIKDSNDVLNRCSSINLREAQRTRAAIVVHEACHTTYTMRGGAPYVMFPLFLLAFSLLLLLLCTASTCTDYLVMFHETRAIDYDCGYIILHTTSSGSIRPLLLLVWEAKKEKGRHDFGPPLRRRHWARGNLSRRLQWPECRYLLVRRRGDLFSEMCQRTIPYPDIPTVAA